MAKSIKFKREQADGLEIHVAGPKGKDRVYTLPFSGSLNMGESMGLMKAYDAPKKRRDYAFFMWFYEFACSHVGKGAIDSLNADQFRELADVWQEESQKGGASLGE